MRMGSNKFGGWIAPSVMVVVVRGPLVRTRKGVVKAVDLLKPSLYNVYLFDGPPGARDDYTSSVHVGNTS